MTIKIGINGLGRMGRLTLRAALAGAMSGTDFVFMQSNDPAGDARTMAHLLNFDSVHGQAEYNALHKAETIMVDSIHQLVHTQNHALAETDWSSCDIVIEASGQFKTKAALHNYFDQGVKRVVVTAPVNEDGVVGVLNVVMGVNHELYDPSQHTIVTAASCTTNCLAPVVKVIQESLGISHGSMTTIHDITNTQTIIDKGHKDLRRARACGMSLIPTTTGSATAITHIFPELTGKLNGYAVRVPLTNASLTDCVFELKRTTTVDEVNALLANAASGKLNGILGYEERPLVSIDYRTDPRSVIVDAPSTMVVNDTQLKLYLWYDNEWGYVSRTAELVAQVIRQGV